MISILRNWLLAAALGLLVPLSSVAAQGVAELLLPVEQDEIAQLLDKSNYGLREQLYFAKRYRIVKVDFQLLERPDAEFSVTPFADLQMRVATRQLAGPSSGGALREWSGELVSPSLRELGIAEDRIPSQLKSAPRVNLWIRKGAHEVSLDLVRKIHAEQAKQAGPATLLLPDIANAPPQSAGARVFTKLDLQTLSGEWFVPAKAARIVIRPVEDDPRYHLIYEQDNAKVPPGGDAENAETTDRLMKHAEFTKQLARERQQELTGSKD